MLLGPVFAVDKFTTRCVEEAGNFSFILAQRVAANVAVTLQLSHVTDAVPLSINFVLFSSIVKYLY